MEISCLPRENKILTITWRSLKTAPYVGGRNSFELSLIIQDRPLLPQLFHRVSLGSIDMVLIGCAHPTESASESQSASQSRAPLHRQVLHCCAARIQVRSLTAAGLAYINLSLLTSFRVWLAACCMLLVACCTLHVACASFWARCRLQLQQVAAKACDINNLGFSLVF